MKLTENGLNRLVENTTRCSLDGSCSVRPIGPAQVYALKSFDFRPDDFAGAVVLTVEEAQEISNQLYSLALLYSTLILELDPDKSLSNRLAKSYLPLNKKIVKARRSMRFEQAEC